MADVLLTTTLYLVFAFCFSLFNILQTSVSTSNEIYQSLVPRFIHTPWSIGPERYFDDIRTADDVYIWLRRVFTPAVYQGISVMNGDPTFCTKHSRCLMGQGPSITDDACHPFLHRGRQNCNLWMGTTGTPGAGCCEACENRTATGGTAYENDLCTGDTLVDFPQYDWKFDKRVDDLSLACAVPEDTPAYMNDFHAGLQGIASFCPELLSKKTGENQHRRLQEFNQMLFVRFSLKRSKLQPFSNDRFSSSYKMVKVEPTGSVTNSDLTVEDTAVFAPTRKTPYTENDGYANAGAFIEYLHPEFSFQRAQNLVLEMKQQNYFDQVKFSSLLAEVTFFNGNVDMFLHLAFAFEMQANGLVRASFSAVPFTLNLYANRAITYFRLFLELVVLVLFGFFVIDEYSNFADGPVKYLKKPLSWLAIISLGFTAITIIFYLVLVLSHDFAALTLPLAHLEDNRVITDEWIKQIKSLQFLSERAEAVAGVASVNICFLFLRLLTLMSAVSPNLGLVLQSLGQGQASLACFFFLFLLLFCGFALSGYLQFGGSVEMFSTWYKAFLTCLRMTMGDFDFKELRSSAQTPVIAIAWFVIFMAIFALVLINMFLSIIVSSYNKQVKFLNEEIELHGEIDSLKIFFKNAVAYIGQYLQFFERLKMMATLNASTSGSKKLNFELIGKLRAQKKAEIYPGSMHCLAITSLFTLFFIAITRICRITDAFAYRLSTMTDLERAQWYTQPDETVEASMKRTFASSGVRTMADVEHWAKAAIIDNMYHCVTSSNEGSPLSSCRAESAFNDDNAGGEISHDILATSNARHPRTREHKNWALYNGQRVGYNLEDLHQYFTPASLESAAGATLKRTPGLAEQTVVDALRQENVMSLGYFFDVTLDEQRSEVAGTLYANTSIALHEFTPRLRQWNLGSFTTDNFVRLIIEPSCYKPNPAVRWQQGYPYVFDSDETELDGCVDFLSPSLAGASAGTATASVNGVTTVMGMGVHNVTGADTGTQYVLAKSTDDLDTTDPKRQLPTQGYVVGLGKTRLEAERVLRMLQDDGLFSTQSRKFSFDWVLYNANYDLFSYNTAVFSLQASGKIDTHLSSTSFPVAHLFSGGTTEALLSDRNVNFVLMLLYVVLVIWVTFGVMITELLLQKEISEELGRPFYGFLIDFFQEDSYQYVSAISAIANIAVIVSWMQFVHSPIHEKILNKPAEQRADRVSRESIVEWKDQQTLNLFAEAASQWGTFVAWSAINSFLLALRILKYFGEITAIVNYKQDENPVEEIDYIWDDSIEKPVVGTQSFPRIGGIGAAETAGVRPGWIVTHINDVLMVVLLDRARKEAAANGDPFAAKIWFEHYINGLEIPCQISYRSSTGMIGTLVKALARCIDQVAKFTLVLLMLLLGFAILFHLQFGTILESFASPFRAVLSLFRFMMGDVFALQDLLDAKYTFTYVLFWVFQSTFFFILSKQFLAVMVYSWKVHREEKQVYGIFRNAALLCENALTSNKVLLSVVKLFGRGKGKQDESTVMEPTGDHFWQKWQMLRHLLLLDGLSTTGRSVYAAHHHSSTGSPAGGGTTAHGEGAGGG
ncbi:unnamed protein product, partial [Amoebophrya sp. A120]|eukprot:GSA120T00002259001.1